MSINFVFLSILNARAGSRPPLRARMGGAGETRSIPSMGGHVRPGWLDRPPVFDVAPIMPALAASWRRYDHRLGTINAWEDEQ